MMLHNSLGHVAQAIPTAVERTDLATLIQHREFVLADSTLGHVYEWFQRHEYDYCAVLDKAALTGICSRSHVGFLMAHRYGFALYARQPISEHLLPCPLIIQRGTPLLDTLGKSLGREGQEFNQDVALVEDCGEYLGMIPVPSLVRLQTTLVAEKFRAFEILHQELVTASRRAGMAEVATGVLHNVGNVLNSVNVSVSMIGDRLRGSKVGGVNRVARLLRDNEAGLGKFLAEQDRGRQLLSYIEELATHLEAEQSALHKETHDLARNVEHIKTIVSLQQGYARSSGVDEIISLVDVIEHALSIESESFAQHHIHVVCSLEALPLVSLDQHKIIQIVVNLLSNAKHACLASNQQEKEIVIRLRQPEPGRIRIEVKDNGIGIAPENLTRIFSHGFTTRRDGHGFGLHSGALAANEMGGELKVHSAGTGLGATFTLELPLPHQPPQNVPQQLGNVTVELAL